MRLYEFINHVISIDGIDNDGYYGKQLWTYTIIIVEWYLVHKKEKQVVQEQKIL